MTQMHCRMCSVNNKLPATGTAGCAQSIINSRPQVYFLVAGSVIILFLFYRIANLRDKLIHVTTMPHSPALLLLSQRWSAGHMGNRKLQPLPQNKNLPQQRLRHPLFPMNSHGKQKHKHESQNQLPHIILLFNTITKELQIKKHCEVSGCASIYC